MGVLRAHERRRDPLRRNRTRPYLLPVSVDGLIVVASICLVELAHHLNPSSGSSSASVAPPRVSVAAVPAVTTTPRPEWTNSGAGSVVADHVRGRHPMTTIPNPSPWNDPRHRRVPVIAPGSGSRADRLRHPTALRALQAVAVEHGVCIRPVTMRRTDLATGQTEVFDVRCGATRDAKCPPCARRARRLREQQCKQGWHRSDEPAPAPTADEEQVALLELRATYEYLRADALSRAGGIRSPTSTPPSPKWKSSPAPPDCAVS